MKRLKIAAIGFLLITVIGLLSGCVAKVPMPDVKEGRFDFTVTYEIDGEVKAYSGVYVCKLDGVLATLVGSSLEWEGYIENEEETDIPIKTNEDGVIYINLGFFPEYFMNDPSAACYEAPKPNLFMIYHTGTPDALDITGEEEVIAEYGVRLISYEYASPIENTFEEKVSFSRFEPSIN